MINILANAVHHTTEYGDFEIYVVRGNDSMEHIVLVRGNIEGKNNVLCRISSECLPGTALFSAECDCKQQIQYALRSISQKGCGIFIYLRQEGRGHGLVTKIRALANKNKGLDTFQAVEHLGLSADVREYSVVKEILDFFKVESIEILCNNPDKVRDIEKEGVQITRTINIPVIPSLYSRQHLQAKRDRGHSIRFIDYGENI